MFNFEPAPNRGELGFKEVVLKNFRFLHRYRFRCVRADSTLVRYETLWPLSRKRLFVNVYHGRGSYEMGVEIGPSEQERETVRLPEMVRWAGASEVDELGQHIMFQTSSREGVQKLVPKMADIVRRYGAPFLRGERRAYSGILEKRRRSSLRSEREMALRRARDNADVAWHAKDFEQVVRLYQPFQEDLMESERMRLNYARKRVQRPVRAPN